MTSSLFHRLLYPTVCVLAISFSPVSSAVSPSIPSNFQYTIYSDSAAELFWQRSTNVATQGYEITRNGESLGVFDALSYFDDTLTPGIEYTYTISAVGVNGERSGTSVVMLRTPPYADTIASLQKKVSTLEQEIATLESQLNGGVRSPVPQTGQKVSISFGDDGDFQAGLAWPDPRFTVNVNAGDDLNDNGVCDANEACNGTVTDNLTGLIWLQNANCFGGRSWPEAINDANTLVGDGTSACGLNDNTQAGDWRLANIKEMQSLMDYGNTFPEPLLPPGHPFTDVQLGGITDAPSEYWTSTSTGDSSIHGYDDSVYSISLSVGWVNRLGIDYSSYELYVLPVRGGL